MSSTIFVAKAIVIDETGKFLLLKRSETHPLLAGHYDLPGGMIDVDEEPGDAIVREVQEETGLDVAGCSKRVLYATTKYIHERSFPTLLYLVKISSNTPTITVSYEHQSGEWADMSRLSEVEPHIAPTYQEALNYLREHKIIEDLSAS